MVASNNDITLQQVRELFVFDEEGGVLRWRHSKGAAKAGSVAGSKHYRGYINVFVCGKRYGAHRLIWLYVHGVWPEGDIDHCDGDKANNRIANLRDVTHEVNTQNLQAAHRRNKLGFLGVTRPAECNFYIARIYAKGRPHLLGKYKTPEEAHSAYLDAKRRLHEGCTI